MSARIAAALAEGIANAELFAGHPRGDAILASQYNVIEQHRTLVGPNGEALAPSSPTRRAKDIAHCEGFIAAYRTATEF